MNDSNTNSVLTGVIYDSETFAGSDISDTIDLGHYQTSREEIYQMADSSTQTSPPEGKTWGQVYHEEVEALVAGGTKNADAVREVAEKYGKQPNAVRGGIFQYKKAHVDGAAPATATRRTRRTSAPATVDDYLSSARKAIEAARDLIDREVDEAKAALDAAQARYEQAVASVKDKKADIEKKLKALS